MNAPINNVSLDDLVFYIDERLSRVNVYQYTFISLHEDFQIILAEIIQRSHKISKVQMIQECGDDYAKVTFISSLNLREFGIFLRGIISRTLKIHNCSYSQFNIM